MKKANTRLAAILLALVMILTVMPVAAFAEDPPVAPTEEASEGSTEDTSEQTPSETETKTEATATTEDPTEEETTAPTEAVTDPVEAEVRTAAAEIMPLITGSSTLTIGSATITNLLINHDSSDVDNHQTGATGSWSWVADTNTLTLDGYSGGGILIYCDPDDEIKLVLSGNSTADGDSYGIACNGSLAISGSDTLTVMGDLTGISAGGNLTISDGTVNATGGEEAGISAGGDLTISGGTVGATSDLAGILAVGGLAINDGTVNATGSVVGISAVGDLAISGGTVNATGSEVGISAAGYLAISDGKVTVTGNVFGNLMVEDGEVTVTGKVVGDLTVEGGTVTVDGTVGGEVDVTGGTVTVAGETVEPGEDVIIIPAPITGIVAPVTGATPTPEPGTALPGGTGYKATFDGWHVEGGVETITGNFAPETVYRAVVTLTAKEGYIFYDDQNANIDKVIQGFLPYGAERIRGYQYANEEIPLSIFYPPTAGTGGGNPVDPDPVDPPSDGGSSDNDDDDDDDRDDRNDSRPSSSRPAATIKTPAAPVTTAKATDAANAAVAAARNSGSTTATANLKNPGEITLAALEAMDEAADMPMKLQADSTVGNAVDVRITLDPALATAGMNLSASTMSNAAKKTAATFEKYFSNPVVTVSFGQAGSFGQRVDVAAKLDLALMDTKRLYFYSYDPKTGIYRRIPTPEYWIDANGYVHFTTEFAGEIVVSEGLLEKR